LAGGGHICRRAEIVRRECGGERKGCRAGEGLRDGVRRILSKFIGCGYRIGKIRNSESRTKDCRSLSIEIIGQSNTRPYVSIPSLNSRASAYPINTGVHECKLVEVEVCQLIVLLYVGRKYIVANAEVQCQTRNDLPVILNEAGVLEIRDVVRRLK